MKNEFLSIPRLGFGLMRLPQKDGVIDIDEVCKMVDECMKYGFNYFDTAYVYHGGKSEVAVKEAIVNRYPRAAFYLADKLPAWELKTEADVQRVFNEQLERTGAGYFDFYLLHSIEEGHLLNYDRFNCWEWGLKMKQKGLIRNFGFSFHDNPELLDKILTAHPEADLVQLQINYVDWDNKIVQSGKCYEVARKHNKPIIVMEPVKGGMLAAMKPELEAMYKKLKPEASIASWALRFAASLNGVMTVLSGMSNMGQIEDNMKNFARFKPITKEESECIDQVTKIYLDQPNIPCTNCRYCVDGCPQEIRIPDIFRALNTIKTYCEDMRPHFFYGGLTATSGKASDCITCGQCESVCPQHLSIIEILQEAAGVFDK